MAAIDLKQVLLKWAVILVSKWTDKILFEVNSSKYQVKLMTWLGLFSKSSHWLDLIQNWK